LNRKRSCNNIKRKRQQESERQNERASKAKLTRSERRASVGASLETFRKRRTVNKNVDKNVIGA
jgi:hypothetical protein